MADNVEERIYQDQLCHLLGVPTQGVSPPVKAAPSDLRRVRFTDPTSNPFDLYDLIGDRDYVAFIDDSRWRNDDKCVLVDVIGGCTPDIVLRSVESQENRIYIEVKSGTKLRDEIPKSQIVRYCLHLLATTREHPVRNDIRRGVFLAAPASWFQDKALSEAWHDFRERYAPLAGAFGITLAAIHVDQFEDFKTTRA